MKYSMLFILTSLNSWIGTVVSLNVTVMVYGLWPPVLLQSIPFIRPGFEVGLENAKAKFASLQNMTTVFVETSTISRCELSADYYYELVCYYYDSICPYKKPDSVEVLVYAGK